ncbi:DMT family transporter [Sneathiella chinensis]|uniref:ABC transporter permease n=1 Tax=Sneathiella chinensis TaxID=349750 RepID=A0ABQ5U991_9PROT|nr:DMT family transporter [Sneathiella chinensis]GLQ07750.1 ABC transporter permease [Sneathiella chinensis]
MTPCPSPSTGMSLANWGLLLFLSVLWGGSFFFNGVAVQEVPVLSVVFARVFIAACALLLFLKIRGIAFPRDPALLKAFLLMGLINNLIPFSLIVAGQTQIGSGLAAILNATTPLFAAVVAHLATREPSERLTGQRIVGILFGIAGVALMIGPDIRSVGFSGPEVLGQLAILGAALSYGVAVVYGRRFGRAGLSPLVTATGQVSGSSLLLLLPVLLLDRPWTFIPSLSLHVGLSLAALALFSTAFAYILYFRLIHNAGATNASLVTLLVPASAVVLGILFLDEALTTLMVLGMGCIALGLLVIDGRIFRHFGTKKPG